MKVTEIKQSENYVVVTRSDGILTNVTFAEAAQISVGDAIDSGSVGCPVRKIVVNGRVIRNCSSDEDVERLFR